MTPPPSLLPRDYMRAWAELLRISALFTVPGDALAGAAALGARPDRGTALAVGASLCLYEAGMALNDWADREEDAVDRPHRPIPSGRISAPAALTAAVALTASGLGLAARAGRPALTVATALSATVWSYDLHFKHTACGPAAMATARALDLLLGAAATRGSQAAAHRGSGLPASRAAGVREATRAAGTVAALPSAAALAAHTYAVTAVSRHEVQGGSTALPLGALATALGLAALTARSSRGGGGRGAPAQGTGGLPSVPGRGGFRRRPPTSPRASHALPTRTCLPRTPFTPARLFVTALAVTYARTAATPFLHAALNPSPPLTQRAVGGGIRAMIPLQATLAARSGAGATALAVMGLVPLARKLARKVSPT